MHSIIAMWAHQRARSTAFLRMMIERGDVTVIHEPLVTLIDEGEVALSNGKGGQVIVHSEEAIFDQIRRLARDRPVFFKDTVEHRYNYIFDHTDAVSDFVHTFMVRDPKPTIASLYEMKLNAMRPEFGYEHLFDIFEMTSRVSARPPVVVNADRLVKEPATVVERYCERVSLPFLPNALTWKPEDRPEWQRTQRWHVDVSRSSGFHEESRNYSQTIDNNPKLRRFYDYHHSFYERLIAHAI